jgi:uncharacterized protein (TIGR00255 family)
MITKNEHAKGEFALKSMTGYGVATSRTDDLGLEVSVKSVNGRFLECKVIGPREYAEFEAAIRRLAAGYFSRGTVIVHIHRTATRHLDGESVLVDVELARAWLTASRQVLKAVKLSPRVSPDTLLQMSGAVVVRADGGLGPDEQAVLMATVRQAMDRCRSAREREGAAMAKSIFSWLDQLTIIVGRVSERARGTRSEVEERLRARIDKLRLSFPIEDGRLAQEIVLLADRADTSEELTRLAEHLERLREVFLHDGPSGKKADFYVQEIFREINTIGAKSSSADQTRDVVELKTIVEQIREQIQNVE